jgi:hypothetical protein
MALHNFKVCLCAGAPAALLLSGCVVAPGAPGVSGHYLGYVRLEAVDAANAGRVSRIDTLGAWAEPASATGGPGSLGLGFRRAERVAVPLDCRIAVIVRSEAQMAQARDLVQSLEGQPVCAVNAADQ